jgi:hypothetical protein
MGLPPQTRDTFCLETKSIQKVQGLWCFYYNLQRLFGHAIQAAALQDCFLSPYNKQSLWLLLKNLICQKESFKDYQSLSLIIQKSIISAWRIQVRWALNNLARPPSAGGITKGQGAAGLVRIGDEAL